MGETPLIDELIALLRKEIAAEFVMPDWVRPEAQTEWRGRALDRTAHMRAELDRVISSKAALAAFEPLPAIVIESGQMPRAVG